MLLAVLGFGYGTIPALGPALDPGRGAWTSAATVGIGILQALAAFWLARALTTLGAGTGS